MDTTDAHLPPVTYRATISVPPSDDNDAFVLSAPTCRVHKVDIIEQLHVPYELVVTLVGDDVELDLAQLLGAEFELEVTRERDGAVVDFIGGDRTYWGLVGRVDTSTLFNDQLEFRIQVGQAFAFLARNRRSRIFQELSVIEILEEVACPLLDPTRRKIDYTRLTKDYALRDYCVQFRETDLAFVDRILAEEGITYAWDHSGDKETLVLLDANEAHVPAGSSFTDSEGDEPPTIPAVTGHGHFGGHEAVFDFCRSQRVQPKTHQAGIWDWKTGDPHRMFADAQVPQGTPGAYGEQYAHDVQRQHETVPGPGAVFDISPAQVERHAQRSALAADRASGSSSVLHFAPGHTFELVDHPQPELCRVYLLTRVRHRGFAPEPLHGSGSDGPDYVADFECCALDSTFCPPRASKAQFSGPQVATVVGPAGEEIHTDEYGRIKICFHWDRDGLVAGDGETSCWVHVVQAWAGPGFGTVYIPRVGMRVVVTFLDGDPEQPLVTGCVYDGKNRTPTELPAERTKTSLKTRSSPGGDGYNELTFEDAAGSEKVILHAQKDLSETVKHNHSTRVGASQSISVGGPQTTTVSKDQTITVKENQIEDVTGDVALKVGGAREQIIEGKETVVVKQRRETNVLTSEWHQVTEELMEELGSRRTVIHKSDTNEVRGGDVKVDVKHGLYELEAKVSATLQQTKDHALVLKDGATLKTSADFTITNGSTSVVSEGGKLKLTGSKEVSLVCGAASIVLTSDGKINVQGASEVKIGTPGTSVACKPAELALNSAKIAATAIGLMELKGALIKVN